MLASTVARQREEARQLVVAHLLFRLLPSKFGICLQFNLVFRKRVLWRIGEKEEMNPHPI